MCVDPKEGSMISLNRLTKYSAGSMIPVDPTVKINNDL